MITQLITMHHVISCRQDIKACLVDINGKILESNFILKS